MLRHKQDFFSNNEALLAEGRRLAQLYSAQPRRSRCKLCDAELGDISFVKVGIAYAICRSCEHLNGLHEDTEAFCAAVYVEEGGQSYADVYKSADRAAYQNRVRDIYLPKADFMIDGLMAQGEDPKRLRYVDFGAGSGYFLAALAERDIQAISGYEPSAVQVALANAMVPGERVSRLQIQDTVEILATIDAEVVSLLGVLEHLREPRRVLQALTENPSVRYVFLLVPMFSPTVFLEAVFPSVMQRHLSPDHTHLFTLGSLGYMASEFAMRPVAEWWFGTDVFDLYRDVMVTMQQSQELAAAADVWRRQIVPVVDSLQLELDRRRMSSEAHILYRFGDKP
jgi:hypothetical protein